MGIRTSCFKKKEALAYFIETTHEDSPVFLKYGPLIAKDHGLRFDTAEDRERLHNALPDLAVSFVGSQEMCKLGRWFSWNQCAEQQLQEFWVAKMIYEHFLDGAKDDDAAADAAFNNVLRDKHKTPQAELRALKSLSGGLGLAYKLMSAQCRQHARILQTVTRACWTWYASQVKDVKNPEDNLKDLAGSCRTGWVSLRETIQFVCHNTANLEYMGLLEDGCEEMLSRTLSLTLHLLGNRAWSILVRCGGPPECYIGVLPLAGTQEFNRQVVANMMQMHWKRLNLLEQARLINIIAQKLFDDIAFARSMPLRLMFCLFEREKFSCRSERGLHLLRGLLDHLPDNKIVEDMHNSVRQDKGKCRNDKRGPRRIQEGAMNANVLELRKINHACRLRKAEFVRFYKSTKVKPDRTRYWSCRHKLPREQAAIMGKKTWHTVSEEWLRRSAAAWIWLQEGSVAP